MRIRITLFRDTPQVILEAREQFLTIKRVRDVPGTGGREKQVEQTTEIEIK